MNEKRKPTHEAWKTCAHVESIGTLILVVDLDCPAGGWVRGARVCTKDDCEACLHWEEER